MGLDVKEKKFLSFIFWRLGPMLAAFFGGATYLKLWNQPFRLLGVTTFAIQSILWGAWVIKKFKTTFFAKDLLSYGKWAIVTGATAGIGESFGFELAAKGMNVLLISRSLEKLNDVAERIRQKYPNIEVKVIAYDFTNPAEGPAFYDKLKETCQNLEGGIGLLVNNVGIVNQVPTLLHEMDEEEVYSILRVNIEGTVRMSRAIIPFLVAQKKGAVINVSSGSGTHPSPLITAYASTKAFINEFSQCLTYELKEYGIDVLVITPYYFISNNFKRATPTFIAPLPEVIIRATLPLLGYEEIAYPYFVHTLCGALVSIYWDVGGGVLMAMKRTRARIEESRRRKAKNQ